MTPIFPLNGPFKESIGGKVKFWDRFALAFPQQDENQGKGENFDRSSFKGVIQREVKRHVA